MKIGLIGSGVAAQTLAAGFLSHGPDVTAKNALTRILDQFGRETEDMGGVEAARAIEPLGILCCIPGFLRNEWTQAFKLLKR